MIDNEKLHATLQHERYRLWLRYFRQFPTAPPPFDLVTHCSEACRLEIAGVQSDMVWARLDDVYWFARLAAHFANARTEASSTP